MKHKRFMFRQVKLNFPTSNKFISYIQIQMQLFFNYKIFQLKNNSIQYFQIIKWFFIFKRTLNDIIFSLFI